MTTHPPTSLTLRAIPRPPETDTGNLFLRLTKKTAWRLARMLLDPSSGQDHHGDEEVFDVDFLPLEITFGDRHRPTEKDDGTYSSTEGASTTVYASYNGGAPSQYRIDPSSRSRGNINKFALSHYHEGKNENIIEIPLDLHPSLSSIFNSLSEPPMVSVRPLSDVPVAERVIFEPLTTSDWELIEMEASMLENGGLLNQVTVVFPGQTFPLYLVPPERGVVPRRDTNSAAWIKVVEDAFDGNPSLPMDAHSSESSDSSCSSEETDVSFHKCASDEVKIKSDIVPRKCLRLMAETEVVVIPKPRIPDGKPREEEISGDDSSSDCFVHSTSLPLRVQPTCSDDVCIGSTEIMAASNSDDECQKNSYTHNSSSPPLGFICVHPSTLLNIPGFKDPSTSSNSRESILTQNIAPAAVVIHQVDSPYSTYSPHCDVSQEAVKNGRCSTIARVYASDAVQRGHIVMHPYLRYQLGVSPIADWVCLQLLSESFVSAHESVLHRHDKVGFTNVILIPSSEKDLTTSKQWRFPDDHVCVAHPFTENQPRISEITFGRMDRRFHNYSALLSVGSLVSREFLQSLDIEVPRFLGAHLDHHLFSLKIQPATNHPTMSRAQNGNKEETDPSRSIPGLGPVIHARDLKRCKDFEPYGDEKNGTTRPLDKTFSPSIETREILMPQNNSHFEVSTIGFSSAIETVTRSANGIIAESSNQVALPSFSSSESTYKHAIIITGEEGSGKTHLAIASAVQLSVSVYCAHVYLDCKKLQVSSHTTLHSIVEELRLSFQEAINKQPSVLILDGLDHIAPNVESSNADGDGSNHHQQLNPALVSQVKVIVDHLIFLSKCCFRTCERYGTTIPMGVVLLITCRDKDAVSKHFLESGILHSVVETSSLDSESRSKFLHAKIFGNSLPCSKSEIHHSISRLGKVTDGFRPHDLNIIASRIRNMSFLRDTHHAPAFDESSPSQTLDIDSNVSNEGNKPNKLLELDIASVLDDFTPLSQQSTAISHNTNTVDWSSIGGLFQVKQSLHDIIIHPMKFKRIYANTPVSLPSGVLLFGPPGSGKSFIVPSLAKKCNLNLITCRGPELLDRYIGASEAKVRQLFARASAAAPALIFFDEFDSLAPQRGSDNTGVTDRVVNQLLTLLDGAERNKNAHQIFIVAATSRPDKIDKALLRPGRLERHVYVGGPESLLEWNDLFCSIIKTRQLDDEIVHSENKDLFRLFCKDLDYAKDFSAADMKAVMDTAHLLRVHEILDEQLGSHCHGKTSEEMGTNPGMEQKESHAVVISKQHILEAFKRARPSLLPKDRKMLQRFYKPFMTKEISSLSGNETQNNCNSEDHTSSPGIRALKTSLR